MTVGDAIARCMDLLSQAADGAAGRVVKRGSTRGKLAKDNIDEAIGLTPPAPPTGELHPSEKAAAKAMLHLMQHCSVNGLRMGRAMDELMLIIMANARHRHEAADMDRGE